MSSQNEFDGLSDILFAALSIADARRKKAQGLLREMVDSDFETLVVNLCDGLTSSAWPNDVQLSAMILLKNSILQKPDFWTAMTQARRDKVQATLIALLKARRTAPIAGRFIASIATIDGMPTLVESVIQLHSDEKVEHKIGALSCLGELADESPDLLSPYASKLLTCVAASASDTVAVSLRVVAMKTLSSTLQCAKQNFAQKHQRDVIMLLIVTAAKDENSELSAAGFSCMTEVCHLYYENISSRYMEAIYALTTSRIQRARKEEEEEDAAALQAMEFWSTLAAKEAALDETKANNQGHTRKAALPLLPEILACISETENSFDLGDVASTLKGAAIKLLGAVARAVPDDTFEPIMRFVRENMPSEHGRYRDAACLALGSCLKACSKEASRAVIESLVQSALHLLQDDPSAAVRESAAWCLGVMCHEGHVDTDTAFAILLRVLDQIRKAENMSTSSLIHLCWVVEGALVLMGETFGGNTTVVDVFLELMRNKMHSHSDALPAVCAALSTCLRAGGKGFEYLASRLLPQLMQMSFKPTGAARPEFCGVIRECILLLSPEELKPSSAMIVMMMMRTIKDPECVCLEGPFMVIGALAASVGASFKPFMDTLTPVFAEAARDDDVDTARAAIGAISDVSRALGRDIVPFCQALMAALLAALTDATVDNYVRSGMLSCIGDIACATGAEFQPFLPDTLTLERFAAEVIAVDDGDAQGVCLGLVDLFAGLCEGFREKPTVLATYESAMVSVLNRVAGYKDLDDASVKRACRLLLGMLPTLQIRPSKGAAELVAKAAKSSDPSVLDLAKRIEPMLSR